MNKCPIVAFRSANERHFRGAKGDTDCSLVPRLLPGNAQHRRLQPHEPRNCIGSSAGRSLQTIGFPGRSLGTSYETSYELMIFKQSS